MRGCPTARPPDGQIHARAAAAEERCAGRGANISRRGRGADLPGYDFVDAKASARGAGATAEGGEDRGGVLRRAAGRPDPYASGAAPDVTGALAAAALHADLYENRTDAGRAGGRSRALVSARRREQRAGELQTLLARRHAGFARGRRRAGAARADPCCASAAHSKRDPRHAVRTQLEPGVQICGPAAALLRLTAQRRGWRRFAARRRSRRFPCRASAARRRPFCRWHPALRRCTACRSRQQTLQPKRCTLRRI